ncbi:MAG: hypothetical protein ABJE95_20580 [Byssovorax sp.]
MNQHARCSTLLQRLALAGTLLLPSVARAESPAPPPPPPGYVIAYPAPPTPTDPKALKRLIKGWEPGAPIPVGYHPEDRPRTGLIVGGSLVFGLLWFGNAIAGGTVKDTGYRPLIAPVVGPLITIATAPSGDVDPLAAGFLIADSILQAGGAAMLIIGCVTTRPRLIKDQAQIHILPVPMRVGAGQGIGLVGTF